MVPILLRSPVPSASLHLGKVFGLVQESLFEARPVPHSVGVAW